jgi:Transglutaminase-like superfamily
MLKPRLFIIFALFLSVNALEAQSPALVYAKIDRHASKVLGEEIQDVDQLVKHLNAASPVNEKEKARAIFTWVIHNISYDQSVIDENRLGTRENTIQQQAENVLRKRMGVCEGYANLYKAVAGKMGLRAELVSGKVKRKDGSVAELGHAWIAIRIDNEWMLCDPTWGAGAAGGDGSERYFLTSGEHMLKDHYPYDPVWQLRNYPLTNQEWVQWQVDQDEVPPHAEGLKRFGFQDSIFFMDKLDTLQRTLLVCKRVLRFNPDDDYALTQLGLLMYEQGVISLSNQYDFLSKADNNLRLYLDTVQVIKQLDKVQNLLGQAWTYLQPVKNPKLKALQGQMSPIVQLQAEAIFLRGLMHYCALNRMQQEKSARREFLLKLDKMRRSVQAANRDFSKAAREYGGLNSQEALKKQEEIVFFRARCHYLLAVSILNTFNQREGLEVQGLKENFTQLERAKTDLANMKNTLELNGANRLDKNGKGLLDSYPGLMCMILSAQSFTQYDLSNKKYAHLLDNPLPYLDNGFQEALALLRESDTLAIEGFAFLERTNHTEQQDNLRMQLNISRGLSRYQMAMLHGMVAWKLSEKLAKFPLSTAKDKTLALVRIRQSIIFYEQAQAFLAQTGNFGAKVNADIPGRIAKLEELKQIWEKI